MLALEAGAFGFLWQNIPSNQLIKSLELVVLGQTVIYPQSRLTTFAPMAVQSPPAAIPASPAIEKSVMWQEAAAGEVIKGLSRRELVILRTLTDGASNRMIALKLVITELTVKVHMKAILRKLRVQNCTQAAIWARTHLGELTSSYAALTALESVRPCWNRTTSHHEGHRNQRGSRRD